MRFKEIHKDVRIDEKEFNKQKKVYKTLIRDLQKAINKYNEKSFDGYGASLLSPNDLVEWDKLGNPNKNEFYYQEIPRFWGMGIAICYRLALIPVEDL